MRLKLTIEYNGTRYSGWQVQDNARTIAGEIERAVCEATGANGSELYGSGRTDAGVHALRQVAHLEVRTSLSPETLRRRINETLPSDIAIVAAESVSHRFHARHDAIARSYIYQVATRKTALSKNFVWWIKEPLDVAAIQRAAAHFVGFHDFRGFSDDDPDEKSTSVKLDALDVYEDGSLLLFHLEGSHFIWKLVRRLVGVLVEVGRGRLTAEEAAGLLTSDSPRPAQLTAPASGLFLERVYYPGDARDQPVQAAIVLTAD
jgi:tRNA pseudouridine38-40 synthase